VVKFGGEKALFLVIECRIGCWTYASGHQGSGCNAGLGVGR
jgi:hypothetical protein